MSACDTKSINTGLHFSGWLSRGGGSRLIMKMTLSGCTFQRGGVISAISMALMPRAHTSTCRGAGGLGRGVGRGLRRGGGWCQARVRFWRGALSLARLHTHTKQEGGPCRAAVAPRQATRHNPARQASPHTLPSYLLSWMTSGAIQCGVPMKVWRLDMVLVSCADTPAVGGRGGREGGQGRGGSGAYGTSQNRPLLNAERCG